MPAPQGRHPQWTKVPDTEKQLVSVINTKQVI